MAQTTIIFVHGTGVRDTSFVASFNEIRKEIDKRRADIHVEPCFWGESCGSRLHLDGASIPTYDQTNSNGEADPVEISLVRWQLLYIDPLYELRLLGARTDSPQSFTPGQLSPGEQLGEHVAKLPSSPVLKELATETGVADQLWKALTQVSVAPEFSKALGNAPDSLTEYREAIARAICAQMSRNAGSDSPQMNPVSSNAELRDRLTAALFAELGGTDMGVFGWITGQVAGLALNIGTRLLQRKRGVLSDAASPAAGDILLYQARGEQIREYIRATVAKFDDPVVLLAHSLGGIACLELLATEHLPNVQRLVTYGSQAPLLYELDALRTLPFGAKLPEHFPIWDNIYDLRDFLSYVGAEVFVGGVTDYRVDNRQPFPQSHCAYIGNPEVWDIVLHNIQ